MNNLKVDEVSNPVSEIVVLDQKLSQMSGPRVDLDLSHNASIDRDLRVQFHNLLISNQVPIDLFIVPEQVQNLTVFLKLACLYSEDVLKKFAQKNFESLAKVCCLTESEEIHRLTDYILGYSVSYQVFHNINGHKSNRGLELEIKSSSAGFADFKLNIDQLLSNTAVKREERQPAEVNMQLDPSAKSANLKHWMVKIEANSTGESVISALNLYTGSSLKINSSGEVKSLATDFSNDKYVPANIKVGVFEYESLFENIDLIEWINNKKISKTPESAIYTLKAVGEKQFCFQKGETNKFMTKVLSPLDGSKFASTEDIFIMLHETYYTDYDDRDCIEYATRHVTAVKADGSKRTFYPADVDENVSERRLLEWAGAGHGRWHDLKISLQKLWKGC